MSDQFGYGDRGKIDEKLVEARDALSFLPDQKLEYLRLPSESIIQFEPSQISVIVHTMFDAVIPNIEDEDNPIRKYRSFEHNREKYPDYEIPDIAVRLELKGYLDEKRSMPMKETRANREPSARFREGPNEIEPANDLLFVAGWRIVDEDGFAQVQIANSLLLPAVDVAIARDEYLLERGGRFEEDHRPMRLKRNKSGDDPSHYAFDDNFGKLNRIPHPDLQAFLDDPTQANL